MFQIHSNDLSDGDTSDLVFVYNGPGHDCRGGNRSPQLGWSGAPEGTKSFAITLFDPDARASGWWHWLVFDLPATVDALPQSAGSGALPAGAVQSLNDYGGTGYGGPCPPIGSGVHHYRMTVYALDVERLGLDAKAKPDAVLQAIHRNTLASAAFTFLYERKA